MTNTEIIKQQTLYLFLDVDGVLNCETTRVNPGQAFLDDTLFARLKHLVDETGVVIILSSAWRTGWNVQEFPEDEPYNEPFFEALLEKCNEFGLVLSDKLGDIHFRRSVAMREYLEKHPEIQRFVILDDWNDLDEYTDHLVLTDPHVGLTDADVEKAKVILQMDVSCGNQAEGGTSPVQE